MDAELQMAMDRGRILNAKLELSDGRARDATRELNKAVGELLDQTDKWDEKERGLCRRIERFRQQEKEMREQIANLKDSLKGTEKYLELKIKEVKSNKNEIRRLKDDLMVQTTALTTQRREYRRAEEEAREAKCKMLEVQAAYVDIESPSKVSLKAVRRVARKRAGELHCMDEGTPFDIFEDTEETEMHGIILFESGSSPSASPEPTPSCRTAGGIVTNKRSSKAIDSEDTRKIIGKNQSYTQKVLSLERALAQKIQESLS